MRTKTTKNLKTKADIIIRTKIIKTKNPNITTKKWSTHGFVAVVAPSCQGQVVTNISHRWQPLALLIVEGSFD